MATTCRRGSPGARPSDASTSHASARRVRSGSARPTHDRAARPHRGESHRRRHARRRPPRDTRYTTALMPDDAPKSAYELAMERLQKKDKEAGVDDRPLTDAQKAAIAEVREIYKARAAEREILHQAALRTARTREELDELNDKLRRDHERLVNDRDRSIAEIRKEKS